MEKDFLIQHYIEKDMTAAQIAEMVGKTTPTVLYHLRRKGIVKDSNTKKPGNLENAKVLKDYEWLFNQYINLNKSYEMIAKEFSLGKTTVARYVKRHKLNTLKDTKQSGKRLGELPKVKTKCANCGKSITVKGCRYEESDIRFCSRACSAKYTAENTDRISQLQDACSRWRETPEAIEFMRLHGARTFANQNVKDTNIEREIRALLERKGIRYEAQKQMYYWCVDFYLPDYDIVIEALGDYWHANPDKYPIPNAMQAKNKRRDKGKAAYLTKCGHTYLEFWETDIMANIDGVYNEIKTVIAIKQTS